MQPLISIDCSINYRTSSQLQISHHYTTKALGRAWAPSPIHSPGRVSSQGRFGPWPSNTNTSTNNNPPRPRQNQHAAQEPWHQDLRILRGRPIERLAVLVGLLLFAAFLAYHHDRFHFVDSAAHHVWNSSKDLLRLGGGGGGSLIPAWSRGVDWRDFAYVSYATSLDRVCDSLMLAESLHRLGAKPETLILYAAGLGGGIDTSSSSTNLLLQQAIDFYGARVVPVEVPSSSSSSSISSIKIEESDTKGKDTIWPNPLPKSSPSTKPATSESSVLTPTQPY
jgi:hypothetical protein